jgi:hypothetical protein
LPDSSEGTGGFAYSVREDSLNEGLIVEGLVSERCRAAYDSNIGYTSVWPYGGQFDTIVSHCVAIDSKEGAFATHINSQGVRFLNCGVIGGRLGGFQLRSRGCLVENCFAQRTVGAGVWVRGAGGGGPFISPTPPNPPHDLSQSAIGFWGDDCVIRNFHALETNLGIGAAIPTVDWKDRGAIHIDAWYCTVDGATVTRSGGPAVSIGSEYFDDAMGITVKNVVAHDVCQLTTLRKYVIDIHNAEPNDLITVDGVTSYSSDNKVEHVVYRRAGANDALLKLVNIGGYGHTSKLIGVEDHDTGISVFGNTTGPIYLSRRYTASLQEDFIGNALSPVWKTTLVGSDPQCVAPAMVTSVPEGGKCRLISGDTGGSAAGGSASVLLDGCSLVSARNWRADLGITAEFKILTGSIALTSYFIGFCDNNSTLVMPWTVTGSTYTSNVTNGVGFLFDTAGTANAEWHLVGVAANVDAALQLSGVAPSSSVYQRLRIDISMTGVATFMINGRVIGTAMTASVAPAVQLTPVVSVLSRTTAVKLIDVDYIFIEQGGIT